MSDFDRGFKPPVLSGTLAQRSLISVDKQLLGTRYYATDTQVWYVVGRTLLGALEWQVEATAPGTTQLTGSYEVWVDSAGGSDSNPGTLALPFATLQRALDGIPLVRSGAARIHLIGAGPYTLSDTQSILVPSGTNAAQPVILIGEFDNVLGTKTVTNFVGANGTLTVGGGGLVPDALAGFRVRMTSGAEVGNSFPIRTNNANDIILGTNTGSPPAIAGTDTFVVESALSVVEIGTLRVVGAAFAAIGCNFQKKALLPNASFIAISAFLQFETCIFTDVSMVVNAGAKALFTGLTNDTPESLAVSSLSGSMTGIAASLFTTATNVSLEAIGGDVAGTLVGRGQVAIRASRDGDLTFDWVDVEGGILAVQGIVSLDPDDSYQSRLIASLGGVMALAQSKAIVNNLDVAGAGTAAILLNDSTGQFMNVTGTAGAGGVGYQLVGGSRAGINAAAVGALTGPAGDIRIGFLAAISNANLLAAVNDTVMDNSAAVPGDTRNDVAYAI